MQNAFTKLFADMSYNKLKTFWKYGSKVIQYGCIIFCIEKYVGWTIKLNGNSMLPTVQPEDRVIVEHVSVALRTIEKGDVIIARKPHQPWRLICKRVVAMEKDIMTHQDGTEFVVPKGHVWLEGDNRANSEDSRDFGPLPYGLLESRVIFRLWPMNRIGVIMGMPQTFTNQNC